MKTHFGNIFWIVVVTICLVGCIQRSDPSREIESKMGIVLPHASSIEFMEDKGEKGMIAIVHMSKSDFPVFSGKIVGYSNWNDIPSGMAFEACGKTIKSPEDVHGKYATGKLEKGVCPILIWDEGAEKLTVLLSTGMM